MIDPKPKEIYEFLKESNGIERVYGDQHIFDSWEAWQYITKSDRIGIDDILQIHQFVMKTLRPDIAGKFRNCPIIIGGHIKPFISIQLIEEDLKKILEKIHRTITPDFLKTFKSEKEKGDICKRQHIAFENIHPFEDGNGRVGRIIYNWHRLQMRLPLHIIHQGKEQMEYYNWFQ
jgi:Fic family protein